MQGINNKCGKNRVKPSRAADTLTFLEALDPETPAVLTRSENIQGVGVIHHLDTNLDESDRPWCKD